MISIETNENPNIETNLTSKCSTAEKAVSKNLSHLTLEWRDFKERPPWSIILEHRFKQKKRTTKGPKGDNWMFQDCLSAQCKLLNHLPYRDDLHTHISHKSPIIWFLHVFQALHHLVYLMTFSWMCSLLLAGTLLELMLGDVDALSV